MNRPFRQSPVYPPPRLYQAHLETFAVTDGGGVLDSLSDQADGTCDIDTNAVSGGFTLRKPIKDILGGPIDSVNGVLFAMAFAEMVTANNGFDRVSVGFEDSVAGLNIRGGIRDNGDIIAAGFGSAGGASAAGADRVVFGFSPSNDEMERYVLAVGYDTANARQGTRSVTCPTRGDCDIDNLYVEIFNNGATAQTMTVKVGFLVWPTIPDINVLTSRG